jgi:hypothetical protein
VPLNDPDSLKSAPNGDLLLSSGDDGPIVDVHHAGKADQSVSFTQISDGKGGFAHGLDDVIETDAMSGTFYLTDTANNTVESFHITGLNPNDYYASVSSQGGFGSVDPAGSQSSTDGGRRKRVSRSIVRKLLKSVPPSEEERPNQGKDSTQPR